LKFHSSSSKEIPRVVCLALQTKRATLFLLFLLLLLRKSFNNGRPAFNINASYIFLSLSFFVVEERKRHQRALSSIDRFFALCGSANRIEREKKRCRRVRRVETRPKPIRRNKSWNS
jgi:hypothetical protein